MLIGPHPMHTIKNHKILKKDLIEQSSILLRQRTRVETEAR